MNSNDRLFPILKGIEIIPASENGNTLENIGAIILDDDINERLFNAFFDIYSNWQYITPDDQLNNWCFIIYYGTKNLNLFIKAIKKN